MPDPSASGMLAQSNNAYQAAVAGYGKAISGYQQQTQGIEQQWKDLYAQQAQYGQSFQQGLRNQYAQNMASQQQSMLARGLGNTTVMDAGARGVNYDYANSVMSLNDQLLQRQNAIQQGNLGFQSQSAQNLAGLYGQSAGFQGQYAGQALGSATQLQQTSQQLATQQQIAQQQIAAQLQGYQIQGQFGLQEAALRAGYAQNNNAAQLTSQISQQNAQQNQQYDSNMQQSVMQQMGAQQAAAYQGQAAQNADYMASNYGFYD